MAMVDQQLIEILAELESHELMEAFKKLRNQMDLAAVASLLVTVWENKANVQATQATLSQFDAMIREHMAATGETMQEIGGGVRALKESCYEVFDKAHLFLLAAGVVNCALANQKMDEASKRLQALQDLQSGVKGLSVPLADAKAIYKKLNEDFKDLECRAEKMLKDLANPETTSKSPVKFFAELDEAMHGLYKLEIMLQNMLTAIEDKRRRAMEMELESKRNALGGAIGVAVGAGLTYLSFITPAGVLGGAARLGSVAANALGATWQSYVVVLEINNLSLVQEILEELQKKETAVKEILVAVKEIEEMALGWKRTAHKLMERDEAGQY
jgi:hypothetical protein